MKKIFKILKMLGFFILGLLAILIITGVLFVNISPQFGKKTSSEDTLKYQKSAQWNGKKFENESPISLKIDWKKIPEILRKQFSSQGNKQPNRNIEPIQTDISTAANAPRITWFGHSSFLIEIEGKNILLDPMFSQVAAPHPWLGKNRYNKNLPIEIKNLPPIDAIIISHDHYDHLDYESIKELKKITNNFFVPMGIGRHLKFWGVDETKITEHNWWQSTDFSGLKLTFTPSQHFSGRGLTDQASTLWGSWVIKSDTHNLFFSGDSGYAKHFKEIGKKFGPFDFAMIESGQYNEQWSTIHMFPEQSVQAAIDLQAKAIMPIHWGAFTLALHDWREPVERFTKAAQEKNIPVTTPQIGEAITLGEKFPQTKWWEKY